MMPNVDTPARQYSEYVGVWERCKDAFAGEDAIKTRKTRYLPPLGSHESRPELYDRYLMRAWWYGAVRRTVLAFSGLLLYREPELVLPPALDEGHVQDVTLSGDSFAQALAALAVEVLVTGRAGVLLSLPSEEGGRPYWVPYDALEILSWRVVRWPTGRKELVRVVLREQREVEDPSDRFQTVVFDRLRVCELNEDGIYQESLYERRHDQPGADWSLAWGPLGVSIRGEPLRFVPFAFVTPTGNAADVHDPPLLDLVNLNISHYRTVADLEHGRHLTAIPTPYVSGALHGDEGGGPLVLGSEKAWVLEPGGRAGMLEFTGAGLEALRVAEEDKRKMMASLGARLLEDAPRVQETFGATLLRHTGEHATLAGIASGLEESTTWLWRRHAWLAGATDLLDDPDVAVKLTREFLPRPMTPDELRAWVMALQAESVSYETFYRALERGGAARPGVTAEEELDAIRQGGPPVPGLVS